MSVEFRTTFGGLVLRPGPMDMMMHNPRGLTGRYVGRIGRQIVIAAKIQVGVDTGALKASIGMVHERSFYGQTMTIGSSLSYAHAHHEGTRPHVIRPNNHEFLRFSAGGRVIYSRQVNHPGTRPNRYLSDQLYLVRV